MLQEIAQYIEQGKVYIHPSLKEFSFLSPTQNLSNTSPVNIPIETTNSTVRMVTLLDIDSTSYEKQSDIINPDDSKKYQTCYSNTNDQSTDLSVSSKNNDISLSTSNVVSKTTKKVEILDSSLDEIKPKDVQYNKTKTDVSKELIGQQADGASNG